MKDVFIYDAIRSPRGRAKDDGALHDLTPQELLLQLYEALARRCALDPSEVDEVILGCVTQYGEQAGNIARTSTLFAGWPEHINGLTINRFCASGIDAISLAALKIGAGQEQAIVAGGVEMMSRVPLLADNPRVFTDPALSAQCQMFLMGSGADLVASLEGISREEADAQALRSQQRADRARAEGRFASVVPIDNPVSGLLVEHDECIRAELTPQQLAALPPAFSELGADAAQLAAYPQLREISHIHTAGNSPALCDGAAVALLGDAGLADSLGRPPRARILGSTAACAEPLQVLTGCIAATQRLLREQHRTVKDVDLFEIHEAFAATMIKAGRELGLEDDKLNPNGGVIALGHPMGATGAIMAGTLLDELERRDAVSGVVAASGAAGSGSALLLERV